MYKKIFISIAVIFIYVLIADPLPSRMCSGFNPTISFSATTATSTTISSVGLSGDVAIAKRVGMTWNYWNNDSGNWINTLNTSTCLLSPSDLSGGVTVTGLVPGRVYYFKLIDLSNPLIPCYQPSDFSISSSVVKKPIHHIRDSSHTLQEEYNAYGIYNYDLGDGPDPTQRTGDDPFDIIDNIGTCGRPWDTIYVQSVMKYDSILDYCVPFVEDKVDSICLKWWACPIISGFNDNAFCEDLWDTLLCYDLDSIAYINRDPIWDMFNNTPWLRKHYIWSLDSAMLHNQCCDAGLIIMGYACTSGVVFSDSFELNPNVRYPGYVLDWDLRWRVKKSWYDTVDFFLSEDMAEWWCDTTQLGPDSFMVVGCQDTYWVSWQDTVYWWWFDCGPGGNPPGTACSDSYYVEWLDSTLSVCDSLPTPLSGGDPTDSLYILYDECYVGSSRPIDMTDGITDTIGIPIFKWRGYYFDTTGIYSDDDYNEFGWSGGRYVAVLDYIVTNSSHSVYVTDEDVDAIKFTGLYVNSCNSSDPDTMFVMEEIPSGSGNFIDSLLVVKDTILFNIGLQDSMCVYIGAMEIVDSMWRCSDSFPCYKDDTLDCLDSVLIVISHDEYNSNRGGRGGYPEIPVPCDSIYVEWMGRYVHLCDSAGITTPPVDSICNQTYYVAWLDSFISICDSLPAPPGAACTDSYYVEWLDSTLSVCDSLPTPPGGGSSCDSIYVEWLGEWINLCDSLTYPLVIDSSETCYTHTICIGSATPNAYVYSTSYEPEFLIHSIDSFRAQYSTNYGYNLLIFYDELDQSVFDYVDSISHSYQMFSGGILLGRDTSVIDSNLPPFPDNVVGIRRWNNVNHSSYDYEVGDTVVASVFTNYDYNMYIDSTNIIGVDSLYNYKTITFTIDSLTKELLDNDDLMYEYLYYFIDINKYKPVEDMIYPAGYVCDGSMNSIEYHNFDDVSSYLFEPTVGFVDRFLRYCIDTSGYNTGLEIQLSNLTYNFYYPSISHHGEFTYSTFMEMVLLNDTTYIAHTDHLFHPTIGGYGTYRGSFLDYIPDNVPINHSFGTYSKWEDRGDFTPYSKIDAISENLIVWSGGNFPDVTRTYKQDDISSPAYMSKNGLVSSAGYLDIHNNIKYTSFNNYVYGIVEVSPTEEQYRLYHHIIALGGNSCTDVTMAYNRISNDFPLSPMFMSADTLDLNCSDTITTSNFQGTSFSAPITTAGASMVREMLNHLSLPVTVDLIWANLINGANHVDIEGEIRDTGEPTYSPFDWPHADEGPSVVYGFGSLDIEQAINWTKNSYSDTIHVDSLIRLKIPINTSSPEPFKVTTKWFDPLDNNGNYSFPIIRDIDTKIIDGSVEILPWKLKLLDGSDLKSGYFTRGEEHASTYEQISIDDRSLFTSDTLILEIRADKSNLNGYSSFRFGIACTDTIIYHTTSAISVGTSPPSDDTCYTCTSCGTFWEIGFPGVGAKIQILPPDTFVMGYINGDVDFRYCYLELDISSPYTGPDSIWICDTINFTGYPDSFYIQYGNHQDTSKWVYSGNTIYIDTTDNTGGGGSGTTGFPYTVRVGDSAAIYDGSAGSMDVNDISTAIPWIRSNYTDVDHGRQYEIMLYGGHHKGTINVPDGHNVRIVGMDENIILEGSPAIKSMNANITIENLKILDASSHPIDINSSSPQDNTEKQSVSLFQSQGKIIDSYIQSLCLTNTGTSIIDTSGSNPGFDDTEFEYTVDECEIENLYLAPGSDTRFRHSRILNCVNIIPTKYDSTIVTGTSSCETADIVILLDNTTSMNTNKVVIANTIQSTLRDLNRLHTIDFRVGLYTFSPENDTLIYDPSRKHYDDGIDIGTGTLTSILNTLDDWATDRSVLPGSGGREYHELAMLSVSNNITWSETECKYILLFTDAGVNEDGTTYIGTNIAREVIADSLISKGITLYSIAKPGPIYDDHHERSFYGVFDDYKYLLSIADSTWAYRTGGLAFPSYYDASAAPYAICDSTDPSKPCDCTDHCMWDLHLVHFTVPGCSAGDYCHGKSIATYIVESISDDIDSNRVHYEFTDGKWPVLEFIETDIWCGDGSSVIRSPLSLTGTMRVYVDDLWRESDFNNTNNIPIKATMSEHSFNDDRHDPQHKVIQGEEIWLKGFSGSTEYDGAGNVSEPGYGSVRAMANDTLYMWSNIGNSITSPIGLNYHNFMENGISDNIDNNWLCNSDFDRWISYSNGIIGTSIGTSSINIDELECWNGSSGILIGDGYNFNPETYTDINIGQKNGRAVYFVGDHYTISQDIPYTALAQNDTVVVSFIPLYGELDTIGPINSITNPYSGSSIDIGTSRIAYVNNDLSATLSTSGSTTYTVTLSGPVGTVSKLVPVDQYNTKRYYVKLYVGGTATATFDPDSVNTLSISVGSTTSGNAFGIDCVQLSTGPLVRKYELKASKSQFDRTGGTPVDIDICSQTYDVEWIGTDISICTDLTTPRDTFTISLGTSWPSDGEEITHGDILHIDTTTYLDSFHIQLGTARPREGGYGDGDIIYIDTTAYLDTFYIRIGTAWQTNGEELTNLDSIWIDTTDNMGVWVSKCVCGFDYTPSGEYDAFLSLGTSWESDAGYESYTTESGLFSITRIPGMGVPTGTQKQDMITTVMTFSIGTSNPAYQGNTVQRYFYAHTSEASDMYTARESYFLDGDTIVTSDGYAIDPYQALFCDYDTNSVTGIYAAILSAPDTSAYSSGSSEPYPDRLCIDVNIEPVLMGTTTKYTHSRFNTTFNFEDVGYTSDQIDIFNTYKPNWILVVNSDDYIPYIIINDGSTADTFEVFQDGFDMILDSPDIDYNENLYIETGVYSTAPSYQGLQMIIGLETMERTISDSTCWTLEDSIFLPSCSTQITIGGHGDTTWFHMSDLMVNTLPPDTFHVRYGTSHPTEGKYTHGDTLYIDTTTVDPVSGVWVKECLCGRDEFDDDIYNWLSANDAFLAIGTSWNAYYSCSTFTVSGTSYLNEVPSYPNVTTLNTQRATYPDYIDDMKYSIMNAHLSGDALSYFKINKEPSEDSILYWCDSLFEPSDMINLHNEGYNINPKDAFYCNYDSLDSFSLFIADPYREDTVLPIDKMNYVIFAGDYDSCYVNYKDDVYGGSSAPWMWNSSWNGYTCNEIVNIEPRRYDPYNGDEPAYTYTQMYIHKFEKYFNFSANGYTTIQTNILNELQPNWYIVLDRDDYVPYVIIKNDTISLDIGTSAPLPYYYEIDPPTYIDYNDDIYIQTGVYSTMPEDSFSCIQFTGMQAVFGLKLEMPDTSDTLCWEFKDSIIVPSCSIMVSCNDSTDTTWFYLNDETVNYLPNCEITGGGPDTICITYPYAWMPVGPSCVHLGKGSEYVASIEEIISYYRDSSLTICYGLDNVELLSLFNSTNYTGPSGFDYYLPGDWHWIFDYSDCGSMDYIVDCEGNRLYNEDTLIAACDSLSFIGCDNIVTTLYPGDTFYIPECNNCADTVCFKMYRYDIGPGVEGFDLCDYNVFADTTVCLSVCEKDTMTYPIYDSENPCYGWWPSILVAKSSCCDCLESYGLESCRESAMIYGGSTTDTLSSGTHTATVIPYEFNRYAPYMVDMIFEMEYTADDGTGTLADPNIAFLIHEWANSDTTYTFIDSLSAGMNKSANTSFEMFLIDSILTYTLKISTPTLAEFIYDKLKISIIPTQVSDSVDVYTE